LSAVANIAHNGIHKFGIDKGLSIKNIAVIVIFIQFFASTSGRSAVEWLYKTNRL
jgi:hypothetical protein